MSEALAALSIDLDSLRHYRRIHGLDTPAPSGAADPITPIASARFGELCDRLGVRGTAFCIGEELAWPQASRAIRALAEDGHEIANHTFSHDYGLTRRPVDAIESEVRRCTEAIASAAGRRPVGFRAPGYTLSAPLLAVLAEQGYRYDSSAFPALPYWLAKAAVMGGLALWGRPSGAILDRPRVLLAPRAPYWPRQDEPYAHGDAATRVVRRADEPSTSLEVNPTVQNPPGAGSAPRSRSDIPDSDSASGLLELPITTGLFGFPIIGTFVATLPAWSVRLLAIGIQRRPLVNLELHGVDLLDPSEVPADLRACQRDLGVPARVKVNRIEAFIRSLGAREWVTLAQAAERFGELPFR